MGELRTVRKYSNRRLYDPAEGRHVTLTELCARVVDGDELRVIDADTKEDITCSVLFQFSARMPQVQGAGYFAAAANDA
jgi:polyhydroxyalkanoate synthesis regulator protein